ncbi:hypothetical protein [Paraburkholderia bonniea]|uniref:hypothetical protein n=1 Tax=Paraburkholderia bonniea TaxID=2152891 RepID=UPI0012914536|nr:hypothetical protein [Paraburkholderia bonniea]
MKKVVLGLLAVLVIGWLAMTTHIPTPPTAAPGTPEWAAYVNQHYFDTSDGQGHGPDIGESEWVDAIARHAKMQLDENLPLAQRCQLIQNQFEKHTYVINQKLGFVLAM